MDTVLGILILLAIGGAYYGYGQWLYKGLSERRFTTSMPLDQVRTAFETKAGGTGWKLIDDGNPMVVQSSLATGVRQQLQLQTTTNSDGTVTGVAKPIRIVTKWWIPKKAHTLRLRLNSFTKALNAQDPSAQVSLHDLRG